MTRSIRKVLPLHSRHSRWRARYGETRTAGSEGDHAEKDLVIRHLAAWSTLRRKSAVVSRRMERRVEGPARHGESWIA
jgi:hypothetical protein